MIRHIVDLIAGHQTGDASLYDHFVGQAIMNPHTLWYPNSGMDFRDILECSTARTLVYKFSEPGIYVHSDKTLPLVIAESADILHRDGRTTVRVLERSRALSIGSYPSLLLMLRIESNLYGAVTVPLIYVVADSRDLFNSILVANDIAISHFVRVREGCMDQERSINNDIDKLPLLGVRYALLDHLTHLDKLIATRTADSLHWSYGQAYAKSSAMIVTPYHIGRQATLQCDRQ